VKGSEKFEFDSFMKRTATNFKRYPVLRGFLANGEIELKTFSQHRDLTWKTQQLKFKGPK